MKTLDQTYELVENLNEEAHQEAWDLWTQADDEDDYEVAEELREDASMFQSNAFREQFYRLSETDRSSVMHWLKEDKDFAEQFRDWFGHDEFDDEFE